VSCGKRWRLPLECPQRGWVPVTAEDPGDLSGECEACGTEIRHAHTLTHEDWPEELTVGVQCAERLSTEYAVQIRAGERRAKRAHRERSSWTTIGWKESRKGNPYRKTRDGFIVTVFINVTKWYKDDPSRRAEEISGWRYVVSHPQAPKAQFSGDFSSDDTARLAAYEVVVAARIGLKELNKRLAEAARGAGQQMFTPGETT
jgi:hypothetical protein